MRRSLSIFCPAVLALCLLGLSACQTTPEEEAYNPEAQGVAERVRHYQSEVAKHPEDGEVYYRLGNALIDMGRYHDAYLAFQRAIVFEPNHAKAYANLGLALRKMGNLKAAVGAYERALDINPADEATLNSLATIAEINEDWERMAWCYGKLHALSPDNLAYTGAYAALLYGLEKYEPAIPVHKALIDAGQDVDANTYRLGFCYYSLNQWPEAIETWEQARTLAPSNGPVNLGLVAAYASAGNSGAAHAAAARCRALQIEIPAEVQQQLDALPG
tara:strand:- start:276 stop:1097 length:822 start_codon:yes stop_codon:yes gene_type:complete